MCKGQLLASQLRKAIAKAAQDDSKIIVLCTFCGGAIEQPKLKVTIGKQVPKRLESNLNANLGPRTGHVEV